MNDIFGVRPTGEHLDPFLQTQVQLITSPNVLTAAGTNPKVAALPRIQTAGDVVQELRKVITVGVVPGTYLIEVSMSSPNNSTRPPRSSTPWLTPSSRPTTSGPTA